MRWVRGGFRLSLVCLLSACWSFHEDERTSPPAAPPVAGSCAGSSCEPTAPEAPDPFAMPTRCIEEAPADNPGDRLCRAGELAVHCVMAPPKLPCPPTFRDGVVAACEDGADSFRVACNACGGVTMELPLPFYTLDIHYGATGQLAGVTLTQDAPVGPCEQEEFVFGRHCTVTEQRQTRSCALVRSSVLND